MEGKTMKVLGMKIAPGQEHLVAQIEDRAHWTSISDHGISDPYLIFVKGGDGRLEQLCDVVRSWTIKSGDGVCIWGFKSRKDADTFAKTVANHDGLTYWLLGPSPKTTNVADHPTLAYFLDGSDLISRNPAGAAQIEEDLRYIAACLLKYYGRQIGVSVIFFTCKIAGKLPERWPEKYEARHLRESYNRIGDHKLGREFFYSVIFTNPLEAREFFVQLVTPGIGCAWQFGLGAHVDIMGK